MTKKTLIQLDERIYEKATVLERDSKKLPEGVLCRVVYPICNLGKLNHNGRMYEKSVWDKVMEDKNIMDKINSRGLVGHAEHPDKLQSSLEKASHVVSKMHIDESTNRVLQEFDVLDTPFGRIIDTMLKAGCLVGCSTRAEGELQEKESKEFGKYRYVVPESYRYITTDFTADASTFDSAPESVLREVVGHIEVGLDQAKIDKDFAVQMLESVKSPSAKSLLENIKKDLGEQKREFSCVQLEAPKETSEKVIEFSKSIADDEIYVDPSDPSFGREESPHVTLKFGLHTNEAKDLEPVLKGEKALTAKLGKTDIFASKEGAPYDVVYVTVESEDLKRLNKKISDSMEHTDTQPEYIPHMTVAYVKPGVGEKYKGKDALEGTEVVFDRVQFSGKDKQKVDITLEARVNEKPAVADDKEVKTVGDTPPGDVEGLKAEQEYCNFLNKAVSPEAKKEFPDMKFVPRTEYMKPTDIEGGDVQPVEAEESRKFFITGLPKFVSKVALDEAGIEFDNIHKSFLEKADKEGKKAAEESINRIMAELESIIRKSRNLVEYRLAKDALLKVRKVLAGEEAQTVVEDHSLEVIFDMIFYGVKGYKEWTDAEIEAELEGLMKDDGFKGTINEYVSKLIDEGKEWMNMGENRGAGLGMGGPRQGDGGVDECVCPECKTVAPHKRGTPCNEQKCPKCGASMLPKTNESKKRYTFETFDDLVKYFENEFSDEPLEMKQKLSGVLSESIQPLVDGQPDSIRRMVTNLRVREAVRRAERDQAVIIAEQAQAKVAGLEADIKKATEGNEDTKKKIDELTKLSESVTKQIEELKKTHADEIKALDVKIYRELQLESSGLELGKKALALLEQAESREEVDKKLVEFRDATRDTELHSSHLNEDSRVIEDVDKDKDKVPNDPVRRSVTAVLEGMHGQQ